MKIILSVFIFHFFSSTGFTKSELHWIYPSENYTNLDGIIEVEDVWLTALFYYPSEKNQFEKIKVFINGKVLDKNSWKTLNYEEVENEKMFFEYWNLGLRIPLLIGEQTIKIVAYKENKKLVSKTITINCLPKKKNLYFMGFSPFTTEMQFKQGLNKEILQSSFNSIKSKFIHKKEVTLCHFEDELLYGNRAILDSFEADDNGLFIFYLNAIGKIEKGYYEPKITLVFPCNDEYTTCCEPGFFEMDYLADRLIRYWSDMDKKHVPSKNSIIFVLDIAIKKEHQDKNSIGLIEKYVKRFGTAFRSPVVFTVLSKHKETPSFLNNLSALFDSWGKPSGQLKNATLSLKRISNFIDLKKHQPNSPILSCFITNDILQNEPIVRFTELPTKTLADDNSIVYEIPIYSKDEMVYITGDTFQLEGYIPNKYKFDTSPTVYISDFLISKHEVSFKDYDVFCMENNKTKPYGGKWGNPNMPAINISWYDAIEYCNWKSKKEGLMPVYKIKKNHQDLLNLNSEEEDYKKWTIIPDWTSNGYRLPTSAEWEFVATERGKNYTDPENIAERKDNISPIGSFAPNSLGVYDLEANVHEWCWDWAFLERYYSSSSQKILFNPKGPAYGKARVFRGGDPVNPRLHVNDNYSNENGLRPDEVDYFEYLYFSPMPCGFRVCRSIPVKK